MKILSKYTIALGVLMMFCLNISLSSCNSKEDPEETTPIPGSVAVSAFSLKSNSDVMADLDSVFFSIDLNNAVIFNADSLPVGSDVTGLVASIKYSEAVETATITMEGGKKRSGTFNYKTNPSDTIDFTGNVILTLTANNNSIKRDYILKVNVHTMKPDSLIWDRLAVSELPSRLPSPKAQKSVSFKDKAVSLIQESNGEFTLSTSSDLASAKWEKNTLHLDFVPQISSLSAGDASMYILSDAGMLYKSDNGTIWEPTGKQWTSILGGYGDAVAGLRYSGEKLLHCYYPEITPETEVEENFPVSGGSNMGIFRNEWSTSPIGLIAGGKNLKGETLSTTWGFDGESWASLSESLPVSLEGASLVPYFFYRQTAAQWIQTEYSVWLAIGGRKSDGTPSRDIYITYDNGIHWKKGSQLVQLPDYIPAMIYADNIIMTSPKSASIASAWKSMTSANHGQMRIKYTIDGYNISWECPYIYLIGGVDEKNALNNTIWRGVLGRLSFTPII